MAGTQLVAADRNAIQEELMAIILAAGLTPDASAWNQVLAALEAMFAPLGGFTSSVGRAAAG